MDFTPSVYPVICGFLLCFLTLGLYFKYTSQAIDYWIFLGTIPSLLWNSDRVFEWMTEVFCSLGRGSFYMDGPMFSNYRFLEIFDAVGVGIFNVDSDTWRLQRKLAHAGLILGEFKAQLVPFLAYVAEEGFNIDLKDVFSRYVYDINMGMVFGRYENYLYIGLPSNEMAEITNTAQRALLFMNVVPLFVWKLQRLFRIVETADLLSIYIKALADNSSNFASLAGKDNYLKDEMLNLFLAVRDTVKSALTWFFWLVSTTPYVEAKILEELYSLVSLTRRTHKWPWVFRSDDLKGLVYLHAALSESLRLYPPLPINRKFVVKKDVLPDGSVVTPGMEILLSFYSVGRMPWVWGEDCLEFKPERWITENGKLIDPTSRFVPDAAFTQMKSVVAPMLFNFHVEVVKGHHVCPQQGTTLYMKNGLQVNIKKRTA
ncbi:hypothetical protein MKW98_027897 [Papaver atlanticum]|uniref:Cytochrome P450 n=1 Tax=Papaver atlanticum TaxID=357466 RepID=A0AAD4XBQ4_9MAGN|nr:hypothetical protein MKW98_027897 [Papaver atlanticum]